MNKTISPDISDEINHAPLEPDEDKPEYKEILEDKIDGGYYDWKITLILMILIFALIFLIVWFFPYVNDAALNRRGSYVPGWFE